MGLCKTPDIFQEKMNKLFQELEYVHAYIENILVLSNGTWKEHLANSTNFLTKLINNGLKDNINKYFFGQTRLEYLGYWITREGIQPLPKKIY